MRAQRLSEFFVLLQLKSECLQQKGITTWFDEEQMRDSIDQTRANGIDASATALICVSRGYMQEVAAENGDDNCQDEFQYARRRKTKINMLPVVMEDCMTNTGD